MGEKKLSRGWMEVENLRRVMQEIRAERLEPPPEYVG